MDTYDKLVKATLVLFPDAEVLEDSEGQIIVYTGLRQDKNGSLFSLQEPDSSSDSFPTKTQCPDCGEEGEMRGHMECMFPQD